MTTSAGLPVRSLPAYTCMSKLLKGNREQMKTHFTLLLSAFLLLWGCGSNDSSSGEDTWLPPEDQVAYDLVADRSAPPKDTGSTEEGIEDFVIPFVYKGMVPGENLDKSDLYLVDSKGRNPLAPSVNKPVLLTTFALDPDACQLVLEKKPDGTPLSTAACSCNLGCLVDDNLTWIAVTVEKPSQTGFAFQVGKFNADLEVKMVKGAVFKNIVDIAFAGDYLYFSQVSYCQDPGCQFVVFRYDLSYIDQPESLFLLPPDDDQDYKNGQHTTDGHFLASRDGSTLAFLSPTIRSSRLYVWRGEQLKELDYVCPGEMQDGHCTGTGSEFSDVDPTAFTSDGKRLAWFVQIKDRLELRSYDTDTGKLETLVLMSTDGKDYNSVSCQQILESSWKFNDVGSAVFNDDGSVLMLLARSHCTLSSKPFTDVLALDTSVISGGQFDESSFKNLTLNQRNNGLLNTIIEGFALSPQEKAIVYMANPIYGEDKKTPLSENSANAKQSRELWVVSASGGIKTQITFNAKFSATWVAAVPPLSELQR